MRIPRAVHELIEWELAVAYDEGYRAALADVAAGHVELADAWRPVGRLRYEQKVAERLADMAAYARRLADELETRRHGDAGWPPVAVPGARRRPRAA